MLRIENIEAAKELWLAFYLKHRKDGISDKRKFFYSKGNKQNPNKTQTNLDDKSDEKILLEIKKIREKYAVKKIQKFWREQTTRDTLIAVNPEGNHTGEFKHFVNITKQNPTVKKSLNSLKQKLLRQAIKNCDYQAVDKLPFLSELTLALLASNKITQQQANTIFERVQTFKDYPQKKTYPILKSDGSFTKEAVELLIPIINNRNHLKNLTPQQLEEFRLMVAALPLSEQIFYVTESTYGFQKGRRKESMGDVLVGLDSIFCSGKEIFHLSCGARDALGLVRFGLEEYVPPINRLGKQKVTDIETGVYDLERYAATHYPGTKPYNDSMVIHEWEFITPFEAWAHDFYHSLIMSCIPKSFLKVFKRFVEIARNKTGFAQSKEIWQWIDSEFRFFFLHHKDLNFDKENVVEMSKLFCKFINWGIGGVGEIPGGHVIRRNFPTPLGILFFIDMIENEQLWCDTFKIDPNYFTSDIGKYFSFTKEIYKKIKTNPPAIQIARCVIYYNSKNKTNKKQHDFDLLDKYIITSPSKESKIKKLKEDTIQDGENWKNSLFLESTRIKYLSYALENLNYSTSEAILYSEYRASEQRSHEQADFMVKPSFTTWIKANSATMLVTACTLVGIPFILFDAHRQIKEQEKINKISLEEILSDKNTEAVKLEEMSNIENIIRQKEKSKGKKETIIPVKSHDDEKDKKSGFKLFKDDSKHPICNELKSRYRPFIGIAKRHKS